MTKNKNSHTQDLDQVIADLEQTITKQQDKINELTDLAQRTRADFENYRKHTEADLLIAKKHAQQKIINELLPIIDVLDTALSSVPEELSDNAWATGIISTHKNVEKLMADLGLSRIPVAVGDLFDHNIHEAVLFDDGGGDKECIAEILRPGYYLNDQLLRPAMVRVARQ